MVSVTLDGMIKQMVFKMVIAGSLLILAGCWVEVKEDVANAEAVFEEARQSIRELEAKNQTATGSIESQKKAKKVNILVYEKSSNEMVKVSVPLWVSNLAARETNVLKKTCLDLDLNDLKKLGPGLIVEIEDQSDRVLIWLK